MKWKHLNVALLKGVRASLAAVAMLQFSLVGPLAPPSPAHSSSSVKIDLSTTYLPPMYRKPDKLWIISCPKGLSMPTALPV